MKYNKQSKINRLEKELQVLKEELKELIENQLPLPLKLDIKGTDGLKDVVPNLKKEYLNGNIDINNFIELLGSIYATVGYEIGHQETLNICEYESNIQEKERQLKYLKYKLGVVKRGTVRNRD
ncbi:hypothetical protein STFE110948_02875 [Streptobacillus felis]|uniref:hypothetical protein n=1 Tax=Streptobacillus felis TaxID=1384509 RepID=UPI0039EC0316